MFLCSTAHREMVVESKGLFDELVGAKKGFGSYCFGQNNLFLGMLRGLKYRWDQISFRNSLTNDILIRAYACGGRVNFGFPTDTSSTILGGLQHLVVIVQLDTSDQIYLTDVGFGAVFGVSGLVRPTPLIEGYVVPGSAPPEEHRVIPSRAPNTAISAITHEGDIRDQWVLQVRRNSSIDWRTLYHFSLDCELFQTDISFQSFGISHMPGTPISPKVICIKMFEVEGEPDKMARISITGDKAVKHIGEHREVIRTFKTELERVKALKELCGVDIDLDSVQHIIGRISALETN